MSSDNKKAKNRLIEIYGKGCFFERAHISERLKGVKEIKGYKKFIKDYKLKGSKVSYKITYHHLKHKSQGGKADVINGANVSDIAHLYIHSLPREQEEVINDMLRCFKINYCRLKGNGEVLEGSSFNINQNFKNKNSYISIPVYPNLETKKSLKYKKNEKIKKEKMLNRAQKKQELQDLINEYYDGEDI